MMKFANHLKNIDKKDLELMTEFLNCDEQEENCICDVDVNMAYLRELPNVFPEHWLNIGSYTDMFGPVYVHQRKLAVVHGIGKYFNVGCKVIRHFFDIHGEQNTKRWGGVKLTEQSTGKDFARNIFDYIDKKRK